MNESVLISYPVDVPAAEGRRAFRAGERYTVASPTAARKVHPDAVILRYADGRPFNGAQGLSSVVKTFENPETFTTTTTPEPETEAGASEGDDAGSGVETPTTGGNASETSKTDAGGAKAGTTGAGAKSGAKGAKDA